MSVRDHAILAFTAQDEAEARAIVAQVDAPIRLRARRSARAFTAGLVLILGVCLGFLGGVGYALLAIGATR